MKRHPLLPPRAPERELSEEGQADYHYRALHSRGLLYSLGAFLVLTIAAMVVIIPFVYMLLMSFKGPAQVGTGRALPEELISYFRTRAAWIEIELTEEQAVALNQLRREDSDSVEVPVAPLGDAGYSPWPEPGPLPSAVLQARQISLEREIAGSSDHSALLELPNPENRHSPGDHIYVFLPVDGSEDRYLPVEGRIVARTLGAVMGRVLNNYRIMTGWDTLMHGNLLAWVTTGYARWFINSLFVAIATVMLGVFFDSLAGFAFAKFNFPFKRLLFGMLLATLMIPYPVTLVPTFFIFAELGFYNTYAALIIPGIVSAFGIFLVRQYMHNIPDEMIAAARVDGASDFQVFRRIILPTARPVLAALAVFRFIFQWNSYLFPLVLTNKDSMKTVQLGLATMEDMHGTVDYGLQMAGSALAVIPILMVYLFMQKHFIAGITLGSAKG